MFRDVENFEVLWILFWILLEEELLFVKGKFWSEFWFRILGCFILFKDDENFENFGILFWLLIGEELLFEVEILKEGRILGMENGLFLFLFRMFDLLLFNEDNIFGICWGIFWKFGIFWFGFKLFNELVKFLNWDFLVCIIGLLLLEGF